MIRLAVIYLRLRKAFAPGFISRRATFAFAWNIYVDFSDTELKSLVAREEAREMKARSKARLDAITKALVTDEIARENFYFA